MWSSDQWKIEEIWFDTIHTRKKAYHGFAVGENALYGFLYLWFLRPHGTMTWTTGSIPHGPHPVWMACSRIKIEKVEPSKPTSTLSFLQYYYLQGFEVKGTGFKSLKMILCSGSPPSWQFQLEKESIPWDPPFHHSCPSDLIFTYSLLLFKHKLQSIEL